VCVCVCACVRVCVCVCVCSAVLRRQWGEELEHHRKWARKTKEDSYLIQPVNI